MKVAFLLDSFLVGGGVAVVIEHCTRLSNHGIESFIITDKNEGGARYWHTASSLLRVLSYAEASSLEFDLVIATWWKTCYELPRVRANRYAYLVQSIESRMLASGADSFLKPVVNATYRLPVAFVTEAKWIRDYLMQIRPSAQVFYVRNGIDKETFQIAPDEVRSNGNGPLRILIEGPVGVWFKETEKAVEIASALTFPKQVTLVTAYDAPSQLQRCVDRVYTRVTHREMAGLYRDSDVLVKLSKVEGMFGPPLEAFHCGATAICSFVTGCDEYFVHGWNGLLTAPEDYESVHRSLELLHGNRRLLHYLKYNALNTAKGWPSWDQASRFMAAALEKIVEDHKVEPYATLLIPRLFQQSVDTLMTSVHGHSGAAALSQTPLQVSSTGMMRVVIRLYRMGMNVFGIYNSRPLRFLRRLVPARVKFAIKRRFVG